MTRALSSQDVFHELNGVYRLDDSITTTTTSATAAKGDLDIDVTSAASLIAGDIIRIGANGGNAEVGIIDVIASSTLTMKSPFARAIASGEAVTKLDAVDLGATDENGVSLEASQTETAIAAGTQKAVYLYVAGNVDQQLSMALRDFNEENLATVYGIDEENADIIAGKGVVIPKTDIATKTYQPWYFEGIREDTSSVTAVVMSAKVAAVNLSTQFTQGTPTVLNLVLKSNGSMCVIIE